MSPARAALAKNSNIATEHWRDVVLGLPRNIIYFSRGPSLAVHPAG